MEYFRHHHRWCGVPNTCRWIAVPILTATRHCCSQTCGGVPLCAKTCMCYIMNEWSMQEHVCMNMIVVLCVFMCYTCCSVCAVEDLGRVWMAMGSNPLQTCQFLCI